MVETIKRYIPILFGKAPRHATSNLEKPELMYLELHLTDHCNLNCMGCDHFSPIAPKHFTDIDKYVEDIRRLTQLFCNIHTIRLMGGEPLLHPDAPLFIIKTREAFPETEIRFVTNGILLPGACQEFINACRNTKTIIDLTVYPPVRNKVDSYRAPLNSNKVKISTNEVEKFFAYTNLQGNSDKQKAFDTCRKFFVCPCLRDGRIYPCSKSAFVHYFNSRFDYNVSNDGIDIHSSSESGHSIITKLDAPISSCKWCSYDYVYFPWKVSTRTIEDWDAEAQRKKLSGK
jgi:hypothetical protein